MDKNAHALHIRTRCKLIYGTHNVHCWQSCWQKTAHSLIRRIFLFVFHGIPSNGGQKHLSVSASVRLTAVGFDDSPNTGLDYLREWLTSVSLRLAIVSIFTNILLFSERTIIFVLFILHLSRKMPLNRTFEWATPNTDRKSQLIDLRFQNCHYLIARFVSFLLIKWGSFRLASNCLDWTFKIMRRSNGVNVIAPIIIIIQVVYLNVCKVNKCEQHSTNDSK